MHPSISRSYIVPAIFLNPVLFLICINTILSRVLPPIMVDAAIQPPPYTTLGPSPKHPHLNIHTSESLCWGFTILIVCAQLLAFGRVSERREEGKARANTKRAHIVVNIPSKGNKTTKSMYYARARADVVAKRDIANAEEEAYNNHVESDLEPSTTEGSDEYLQSTDSEIIL